MRGKQCSGATKLARDLVQWPEGNFNTAPAYEPQHDGGIGVPTDS